MSSEIDTTVARSNDLPVIDSGENNLLSFDPTDPQNIASEAALREKQLMETAASEKTLVADGVLPPVELEGHSESDGPNARWVGPGSRSNSLERDPFSLAANVLDLKQKYPDVFSAISDGEGNIVQDKVRAYLQAANDFGIFTDKNSQAMLKTLNQLDFNFAKLGADGTITADRLQQLKAGQVAFEVLHLSHNRPEIYDSIVDENGNITKDNVDKLVGDLIHASIILGIELPSEHKLLVDLSANFDRLSENGILTPEQLRNKAFAGRSGGRGLGQ